jgi:hypothetical protein
MSGAVFDVAKQKAAARLSLAAAIEVNGLSAN